ncbi:MAG TPA: hypothetical protein VNJ04_08095 [Gemmatimonadaceae bacterium]|nr:hypothetical protein [Gemmatimonadaceae bacterium]
MTPRMNMIVLRTIPFAAAVTLGYVIGSADSVSAGAQMPPFVVLKVQQWDLSAPGPSMGITLASGLKITVPTADIHTDHMEALKNWRPQSANYASAADRAYAETTDRAAEVAAFDTAVIRPKCAKDWPDDFTMRAYCEQAQQTALRALANRSMPSLDQKTIRAKCAKDWTEDFTMRDYCETQQLEALRKIGR